MMTIKTKMGLRGQLVIPKIIRESLGLIDNKVVLLEVNEKELRLIPTKDKDIASSWEAIAKSQGTNVKKNLIYGDKLYEEVF